MLGEFILESVFRFNIMITNIFEDLTNSVISCFNKYFDFETRSSRKEFWYWQLFRILMFLSITYLESLGLSGLLFISNFIFLIPEIAVSIRRLHDINKSGWFQAIPIPAGILETGFAMNRNETGELIFLFIGLALYIYLIVLYCTAGDSKQNRFGKNPLKQKK